MNEIERLRADATCTCDECCLKRWAADEIDELMAVLKRICKYADEHDGYQEIFAIAAAPLNQSD